LSASTSPLPYTGNKRCIINTILAVMPQHNVYIEPCCGSAEIFFSKPKAEKEILNDYNGDLINLLRTIQDSSKLAFLLGRLFLSVNSEQIFKLNKELLRSTPNILDDAAETAKLVSNSSWKEVKNAVAFFENQVYSFSSTGQTFGIARRDIVQRIPRLIKAYGRIHDAIVLHRDYKDVIQELACEGCYIVLDPPYKGTEGMYPKANFNSAEHEILFDLMADINSNFSGKAKFLITYNNDPYIRNLAESRGFDTFVQTRLHNMRQAKERGAQFEELLIANYDLERQAAENHIILDQQNSQLTLFDFKCDYTEE